MGTRIRKVYLISHTHTDIGYTDYQDTVFEQHREFIDRAIELCEETATYPDDASYKWTCESAAVVEQYLRRSSADRVERFLSLHRRGRMAVAAMGYNWTPLVSPAAMVRSLAPAARLRKEYGLTIRSAMQCDVNGAAWLWADLLPAIGVDSLTMSINMHRGGRPHPDLTAFWWEGPAGGRLLTYNGPHYLYGIFRYGLGDVRTAELKLAGAIERLEASDYPYDFLYAQVTHPARVDNGPPDERLPEFIRQWNDSGRQPHIEFVTLDRFCDILKSEYAEHFPTWRGDWVDWWADGPASSAYETALSRGAEALLPALDLLATRTDQVDLQRLEQAYERILLYDEHTWGSFASVRHPHSPLVRANWNAKASYAYGGYSLTHELLARGGRALARSITGVQPEGERWRYWGQYLSAGESSDERSNRFLVINPLAWRRRVDLPAPPDVGGAAPYAVLESFLAGNYRDLPPLETQAVDERIRLELPAFGCRVVESAKPPAPQGGAHGDGWMENEWYRVQIDPATGGLLSWFDKEQGRELASTGGAWRLGEYVYEWVESPEQRRAIFALDFDREDFGVRHKDTPFRRRGPVEVEVGPCAVDAYGLSLAVRMQAPGARIVRTRYTLPHHKKQLELDMVVDKLHVVDAESVYVPFPLALERPHFHLDLNGVPMEPEQEQLPGSCRDWYSVQRWAEVGDERTSVVLVPLDSPLVQIGGIQTGRWLKRLEPQEPTLVSWALQNHWDTNFKASQGGEVLLRYVLTSTAAYSPAAASRFAAEALVPPIVVRVPGAELGGDRVFLKVDPEGVAEVRLKRAADGRGLIVQALNLTREDQAIRLSFPQTPLSSATLCSPVEEDHSKIPVAGEGITVDLASAGLATVRVRFRGDDVETF